MKISKSFFNQRVCELILIILTGTLNNTPLQLISIKLGILIVLLFIYLSIFYFSFNRFNKLRIYILVLAVFPIFSAAQANKVFGQSILDGLLTHLNHFYFLIIIYLFYYFKYKKNPLLELEKSILLLGYISVIILTPLKIFFSDYEIIISSFDGSTEYIYSVYSLSSAFIVWTGFIYLAKYKNSNKSLVKALLFISYPILFYNARSYLIILIITLAIFIYKELDKHLRLKGALLLFGLFNILFVSYLISPTIKTFFDDKSDLFADAINIIDSSKEVEDISANVRALEVGIALPYIEEYYLFGTGVLNTSTKKEKLEEWFYPNDIGLIGVIFNYGLIGMAVFMYQFKLFNRRFKNVMIKKNNLLLGTSYYLLLYYISSIFSGSFVYGIGICFLLLGILIYGEIELKKNK